MTHGTFEATDTEGVIEQSIVASEDDGRETVADGSMFLTATGEDLRNARINAFRFPLDIPNGATVGAGAYIQFTASQTDGSPAGDCLVTISIEDADDSAALAVVTGNVSDRTFHGTTAPWTIAQADGWTTGDRTELQRTPSLTTLLQAIVDRPGWHRGQHVLFTLLASTASDRERSVATFDHATLDAPTLHATWAR